MTELLYPLKLITSFVAWFFSFISDFLSPILSLVIEMQKMILSLLKLILYAPSVSIMKLAHLLKDGLLGLLLLGKEFFSLIKQFIMPMSNPSNRQATLSFLQVC